jgi:lipoprotein-releasing system ATP-binding protein
MSRTGARGQASGVRSQESGARGQGPGGRGQGAAGSGCAAEVAEAPRTAARRGGGDASVQSTQYSVLGAPAAGTLAENARRSSSNASEMLLSATRLEKSYRKGKLVVPVLKGVDFQIRERGFVAVVGQSGCGKSTLLHLLGTLDGPDAGEIRFQGQRIDNLAPRSRDMLRNQQFGMIFQFYHLLPELSTLENVLAPVMIRYGVFNYWRHKREHTQRAKELLDMVGLGHRLTHKPRELSGGEMQRAAIARALIAQPKLLLADEPTGNLDQKTGGDILALLKKLNREQGLTIVMVTHDQAIAKQADHVVRLVEGRVAAS